MDVGAFVDNMEEAMRPTDPACPSAFQPVPLADLAALWRRCRKVGLKIAVLSADDRVNIETFLTQQGLDADVVLSGDDGRGTKPDPVALQAVADDLGEPVERLAMVGDSEHDTECGRRAGAWSIGVLSGVAGKEALCASADFLLENVADLPLLFEGDSSPWGGGS